MDLELIVIMVAITVHLLDMNPVHIHPRRANTYVLELHPGVHGHLNLH